MEYVYGGYVWMQSHWDTLGHVYIIANICGQEIRLKACLICSGALPPKLNPLLGWYIYDVQVKIIEIAVIHYSEGLREDPYNWTELPSLNKDYYYYY